MQLSHVKNVVGLLPIHQRRTYDESSEVCGRRADLRCPIGAIYRCTLSYISCYVQDILTNLIFPLRRKFSTSYLICYPRRVCEQNKVSSQLHSALLLFRYAQEFSVHIISCCIVQTHRTGCSFSMTFDQYSFNVLTA